MNLISKEDVKRIFISSGFKVQEGEKDLKPYVYDAAWNLLELMRFREENKITPLQRLSNQTMSDYKMKYELERELVNLESKLNELRSDLLIKEIENQKLMKAVMNLIEQKGRYSTEIAYKRLVDIVKEIKHENTAL